MTRLIIPNPFSINKVSLRSNSKNNTTYNYYN